MIQMKSRDAHVVPTHDNVLLELLLARWPRHYWCGSARVKFGTCMSWFTPQNGNHVGPEMRLWTSQLILDVLRVGGGCGQAQMWIRGAPVHSWVQTFADECAGQTSTWQLRGSAPSRDGSQLMAHARLVTQLVEAAWWVRSLAAAWRTELRTGCSRLEVAVYPERDDGWHGVGVEAKLLHEQSGRGPEATLTSHFTVDLRSSQPHCNDVARQSALFHRS